jgi:hypothetical protein
MKSSKPIQAGAKRLNSFLSHAEILISRYQFRFSGQPQFHGQKIFANLFINEETYFFVSSFCAEQKKSILRFSHSQFLSTGTLFII